VKDFHCPQCNRLLFKSDADQGRVQVPCPRCKTMRMVDLARRPPRLAVVRA
jgi:phage FluMu protein Com